MRRKAVPEMTLHHSHTTYPEAPAPCEDMPLIDKIVGYAASILLLGWLGLAYLRSLF
jgi:hypothetical protein